MTAQSYQRNGAGRVKTSRDISVIRSHRRSRARVRPTRSRKTTDRACRGPDAVRSAGRLHGRLGDDHGDGAGSIFPAVNSGYEQGGCPTGSDHGRSRTVTTNSSQGRPLPVPPTRRSVRSPAAWKEAHNRSHEQVRARVEHVFARMKNWKILRDCRLKGEGVHHAIRGVTRLHNLALAG